jgi:solute carrier family 13 (sodium-dependent dicarboxylate transporter), member 2/3/5
MPFDPRRQPSWIRVDRGTVRWLRILSGPVLAIAAWVWVGDDALPPAGRTTAAVAVLMGCWWLTQPIPLAATALLPVVLFPLLGAGSIREATAPYARPLVFLLLGGFLLGSAIQKCGLHRRAALLTLLALGAQPRRVIAGFMAVGTLLSIWASPATVAIMLLPLGVSVLQTLAGRLGGQVLKSRDPIERFAPALLLGIAYAVSIGGMLNLFGDPTTTVLAGPNGPAIRVSRTQWLSVVIPLVLLLLPLAWFYLTHLAFPLHSHEVQGGRDILHGQLIGRGPMTRNEWTVLVIVGLTAACWILRPALVRLTGLTQLDDAVIAVAGGIALFLVPVEPARERFAMDWETAKSLPWGMLVVLGGGLSLGTAFDHNGLNPFVVSFLADAQGMPQFWGLVATIGLFMVLTEIATGSAAVVSLLPLLSTTPALGHEAGPLLIAASLATSCAFMLPAAAAANAVVFSSGRLSVQQMARTGLALKLVAMVLIAGLVTLLPASALP